MGVSLTGLVLDSSVLIRAERNRNTTTEAIRKVREAIGDLPIVICSLTIAELAHRIYRADTPEKSRMRRQFLDELKAHAPVHLVTEATAEIVARIGAEQAAQGIVLPLGDLIIGSCALELGYSIATSNLRDFRRIPGLQVVPL